MPEVTKRATRSMIRLKIKRQMKPSDPSYWEDFEIPYQPGMNVISCLQEIQKNPVNADGKSTSPVVWDCNCLEEVCGACSMVINGIVRQACSALIDQLTQPIVLSPMHRFPLVRDLVADRQRMFDALKRIKAWIHIDGTYDLGDGPRMNPNEVDAAYKLSTCMTCGCCLEVCPQINPRNEYMGAAIMSQVRLFNTHPTGKYHAAERLRAVMGAGGIADCGNAQNCVRACPKEIPLTTSISEIYRQTTLHGIWGFFKAK